MEINSGFISGNYFVVIFIEGALENFEVVTHLYEATLHAMYAYNSKIDYPGGVTTFIGETYHNPAAPTQVGMFNWTVLDAMGIPVEIEDVEIDSIQYVDVIEEFMSEEAPESASDMPTSFALEQPTENVTFCECPICKGDMLPGQHICDLCKHYMNQL